MQTLTGFGYCDNQDAILHLDFFVILSIFVYSIKHINNRFIYKTYKQYLKGETR